MMMHKNLTDKILKLYRHAWQEDDRLEFKSAKGGIPAEMWASYSAFANTEGGYILLGVEDDGAISGVTNPQKVIDSIFLQLNNPQKCSVNLCDNNTVFPVTINGKQVVVVAVPRADAVQRPVYLRNNEATCYFRRGSCDVLCKHEDIIRMRRNRDIVESPSFSLDSVILPHSGVQDIDESTLRKFRLRMELTNIGMALQDLETIPLLQKLGGYRIDRATGEEGLTMAGLLMFGTSDAIAEYYPHFQLDYFEYDGSKEIGKRWIDRITNDGTWPGNLYEFFYKVLPRLTQGLKLPFRLNEDLSRNESTPAHVAVREALANAIIHADYFESFGIRIDLSPAGLVFMNPGSLLVDREQIFSDQPPPSICRNKGIQKMFQALGVVDRAASGIDKIVKGWTDYCIAMPSVKEKVHPDRVVWSLPSAGLIARERVAEVEARIGRTTYTMLDAYDKLILLCIYGQNIVGHHDVAEVISLHPADLSKRLARLVSVGLLQTQGRGRGMKYTIRCKEDAASDNSLSSTLSSLSSTSNALSATSDSLSSTSDSLSSTSDSLSSTSGNGIVELPERVRIVRTKRRTTKEEMRFAILELCALRWMTIRDLAIALDRTTSTLRPHCEVLVATKLLSLKHAGNVNHPQQAYRYLETELPHTLHA